MTKPARQMKLGVSMIGLGYHVAAWRHPDVPADGSPNIRHSVEVAQTAERGKLDMVFLADAVGIREYDEPPGALCRFSNSSRFEPITLLAALSMATQRIGLVATLSTTYSEPFHVARQFASLDHLSGGRAGWNVVTSVTPMEAQNFNYETTPDYDKRYGRAAEFVEVVRGLWDCWEDDALVRDKASGIFFDPAKMHVLNHKGEHFSVRGPINIPRTPQGYPVIVQAGASEQGQDMAAATADVVFAASASLENAQKYYASVKGRMAKFGRPTSDLHIMPGIMAVVGRTEQEAQDKYGQLQDLIDPKVGLAQLAASLGDLSGLRPRRPGAGGQDQSADAQPRAADARHGAARQPHHPPALSRGRGRQRPPRRGRLGDSRSPTRWRNGSTQRGGRRLQLRAGGAARRHRAISSIWWCRSCSGAGCSAPNTKARRCAKISACRIR